jgi:hypothetical protein
MNLVSGKERREFKKKLHELKRFVRNYNHYNDIDRVYGGGLSDERSLEILNSKNLEISRIENILKL